MLVLSRKVGEKILVGDKISVTVVRIGPGIVRIGVEAPADMAILREELVTLASDCNPSAETAKNVAGTLRPTAVVGVPSAECEYTSVIGSPFLSAAAALPDDSSEQ